MGQRSIFFAAGYFFVAAGLCFGHPGGLDASGGHHDRKRGGYHYHRGGPAPSAMPSTVMPAPVVRFADFNRGNNYRTRSRITPRRSVKRTPDPPPPDIREQVEQIGILLDGNESADDREAASRQLDEIATSYEGTAEAAEALQLLREIRAEEELERRERDTAASLEQEKREQEAERIKREDAAAAKLRLAKVFLDSGKTSHARRWLEDVIRTYPDTSAAREASELLSLMAKSTQEYGHVN